MSDVSSAPGANGAAHPLTPREQLIAQAHTLADQERARRDELREELATIEANLRSYEKAVAALDPDSVPEHRKPGPKRKDRAPDAVRQPIGAERLAQFERAVRELGADDREFRQIDALRHMGINVNSGTSTYAFEELRKRNIIRLSRNAPGPGGGKFYRLTRPALRAPAGPSASREVKPETRERIIEAVRAAGTGKPVTIAAISEHTDVSDVALRNGLAVLAAEGVLVEGKAEQRADGESKGKRPRTYLLAQEVEA